MLSELCVRRPVSATMLVMSLVVLGMFSFRGLGVDLFPKADPATVSVTLLLPGASPDEMSTSVVEPMEQAISGVSGIDEISARIAEGRANITVRFVLERDINDASNDVREKVAGAIRNMPPQLLPPVITKVDPDADPVMSLIVSSDAMSLRTLTELTDKQIARVIQTVNGVGEVSLAGGRAREIHVVVDIEKLKSYGLSMQDVRDALVAENVEIPGGTIEQGKGQLLLRTLGRVDASQDFDNIVVSTKNGTPIRISDIGHAEDGFERPTSAVWLGETPAVMLDIRRAMGENTVAVIEGVRAKLATIDRSLPSTVKITVIRDDSRFIYASISSLEEHLIFGALFATDRGDGVHPQPARRHHLGAGDSGLDHLVVHADEPDGVHAEQHDAAGHHARRRHRHRRCDRRAREHLPLHGGEGLHAVRGGDPGHARGGARGDGDDALTRRHLHPDRVHERLRQAVHQSVRLDDGVRDHGVDARQLHADADAELAVPPVVGRRRRSQDEGGRVLSLAR